MADRLSAVVANSLETRAKTQDLARQAYQSHTQFHRLFRTVIDETPAAMRRRLGVESEGFDDPMEYEESVAPWNQEVALKTP